jgi:hypothetical protein
MREGTGSGKDEQTMREGTGSGKVEEGSTGQADGAKHRGSEEMRRKEGNGRGRQKRIVFLTAAFQLQH